MEIRKNRQSILMVALMLIGGGLFFFFLGENGTILCKDSVQYLEYTDFNAVMPFYPSFINVIRWIFGEQDFMQYIFVVQGIIALFCSIYFAMFLKKYLSFGMINTMIVFILSLLPYTYSLPEYVSSHEVMTESLAFPIFYLFFASLISLHDKLSLGNLVKAGVSLLLLVMLRTQLIFFVGIVAVVFLIKITRENDSKENQLLLKRSVFVIVSGVLIFVGVLGIKEKRAENSGEKASQFVNAFFGKALTIMDEEDIKYYETEQSKRMFEFVYKGVDEQEWRLPYAQDGLLMWEDLIHYYNENMKLGNDLLYKFYSEIHPDYGYYEKLALVEKGKSEIVRTVIGNNIGTFLYSFFLLMPSSFLSIVFIQKRSIYLLCNIYAIIFYVLYLFLLYQCIKKKQWKEVYFAILSLAISVANVVCTNIVHYGLQRYLIYTMGVLYMAMFLMLRVMKKTYHRTV